MVSSLAPINYGTPVQQDFGDSILSGMNNYRNSQQADQNLVEGQQKIDETTHATNVRNLSVMVKLLKQVRQTPPDRREQFISSLDNRMLQSIGVTPQDVAQTPRDDQGLDNIIAQGEAALSGVSENTGGIQQGQYVEGVGYVTLDRGGKVDLRQMSPEQQAQVKKALEAQAKRQADAYGLKVGAGLDVEADKKPIVESKTKTAVTEAENKANLKSKPELERQITMARELAQQDAAKISAQSQGLSHYDDAASLYNELKNVDFGQIYGFGEGIYPDVLRSPKNIANMAKINQLASMLLMASRGELKGQGSVSDSDMLMAANAATLLGKQNLDPATVKAELDKIMNKLAAAAGKEKNFGGTNQNPVAPPQDAGSVKTVKWGQPR